MSNLLQETIGILTEHGKVESDIKWVGTRNVWSTWENFKNIADLEYDSGFGSSKVADNLLIVGKNWWLTREEYDGSEWWEFHTMPICPLEKIDIKALTVNQAEANGIDVSCGWESLESLNGHKEYDDE